MLAPPRSPHLAEKRFFGGFFGAPMSAAATEAATEDRIPDSGQNFRGFSRMRYHWHKIAENGPLPVRFEHSLVYIKDEVTKVFAIGIKEDSDSGLEVYELDRKFRYWSLIPSCYENDLARKAATAKRHGQVLAGIGSSIFVFGGTLSCDVSDVLLKFDTIEQKWCIQKVTGPVMDIASLATTAAIGEKLAMFRPCKNNELVYFLDTAKNQWIFPKVSGTPPPQKCVHTAVTLGKDRILVHGGSSDSDLWILELQKRSGEEVFAWSKTRRDTVPIVFCGPSGVGKGTLITKLMREFPDKFGFSVSHTTRKPREKEIDGVHYHFTARDEMELSVAEGKFLEHAHVHGNIYGTSIAAVEAVSHAGKRCILDIDVQGTKSVRQSSMQALYIFIAPPSFNELERRLRARGTETEEQVNKRLETAKRELEIADEQLFDYILVNDDLESTYKQLKAILGLLDVSADCPGSLKLMTMEDRDLKSGRCSLSVHLLDSSTLTGGPPKEYTDGLKCLRLEASAKQIPCEYTNALHLSEIEILMTGTEGGAIVLRLGK